MRAGSKIGQVLSVHLSATNSNGKRKRKKDTQWRVQRRVREHHIHSPPTTEQKNEMTKNQWRKVQHRGKEGKGREGSQRIRRKKNPITQ